jgi:hypothetical protein
MEHHKVVADTINNGNTHLAQEEFDIKNMIIKEDKLRNNLGFRYLTVPYEDE